jgi:putative protease
MPEKEIGKITHYFSQLSVGIIELTDALVVGDNIHIKGHSEDFTQSITSMQIEHVDVSEAKAGDSVGIKVAQKVHPRDKVYKVIP